MLIPLNLIVRRNGRKSGKEREKDGIKEDVAEEWEWLL